MRTATTLHRTAKGWTTKHYPDDPPGSGTPFVQQKRDYGAAVQGTFPKDVLAIRFQPSDGKAKLLDATKATQRVKAKEQAELRAEAKQLEQIREGKEARIQGAIAELEPRITREKERVEIFKAKVAGSKDTKWNPQFLIEHKQAIELLKGLEKQHAELKAELAEVQKPPAAAPAAAPATA